MFKAAEVGNLFPFAVYALMDILSRCLGEREEKEHKAQPPWLTYVWIFPKTVIFFIRRSCQVELEYFGQVPGAKPPTTGKRSTCTQQNKNTQVYTHKSTGFLESIIFY